MDVQRELFENSLLYLFIELLCEGFKNIFDYIIEQQKQIEQKTILVTRQNSSAREGKVCYYGGSN